MEKSSIVLGVVLAVGALTYGGYQLMFRAKPIEVDVTAQVKKFAEYSNQKAFVSAKQVKEMLDAKKDVVIIGALNPIKPDKPIQGSFAIWRDDYSAEIGEYPFEGMRNSTTEMEAILSQFGATPNSTIVVYAANSHHDAARLFWQIKNLGHQDVRYLDGGLNAWIGAGYPTDSNAPKVTPSQYQAPNPQESVSLATLDMVLEAQNLPNEWVIIDTRGQKEFEGSTTISGAFGPGTIPNSVHINWTQALNQDSTLKTAAELNTLYGDVIKNKKVITYCQSGVRSAHTQMILQEALGAKEIYNYDGSWIEYSYVHYEQNRHDIPVQNGQKS